MDIDLFVQNVKMYCKLRGVKPTIACEESGAGKSLISQLTTRGSFPSIERVQKLADYLGVTTSDLLGEKKESPDAVSDAEAALDRELISRLIQLSPEELEKVDAFVQGLLAAR